MDVMTRGIIEDDATFLSSAIKWTGKITYTSYTFEELSCYKATSFSHKLTVLDSNFVPTSLTAQGGCLGVGYFIDTGVRGYWSSGAKSLSQNNPTSGTYYSKSLSNSNFAYIRGSSTINTSGSFKYKRLNETDQPIRNGGSFSIVLSEP